MEKFDAIIIGTGQAGPFLAGRLAEAGKRVAIVERLRFGGTCVNNGCTPTKALIANAKVAQHIREAATFGIDVSSFAIDMKRIKARKDAIVKESSVGIEKWLKGMRNCTVFEGHAYFESLTTISVNGQLIEGERIYINVGTRALIPKVSGLDQIPYWTNSSIMDLDFLPEHLLIVGGGYIALEFGQLFRRFGSRVTIFQRHPFLLPKEDEDISQTIREILEKEGVEIVCNAHDLKILPQSKAGEIHIQTDDRHFQGTHLLVAAGRVPNTADLGLEKAGVQTNERGYIKVDETLRSSQPHIWALGDCNGRGAFTHTAYNDYEIVADNLLEKAQRKVTDRIPIYALYCDPPLGRVGMNAAQALASGKNVLVGKLPMTRVARAREKGETEGFMKILVDADTQQILGASFLGTGCDEVIQMIANIMYARAPFTTITHGVYIHPTVSELVPTLLSDLKPLTTLVATQIK